MVTAATNRLRGAPATLPALAAVAVLAWFAAVRGGFPVSEWGPATLAVLALLGLTAVTVPNRWATLPRTVRLAVALLTAYTAWSFLSIGWAVDKGAAWEGSARTLLFLVLFCLFALWRQRAHTAAFLLGAWTLVVGVIALTVAVRLLTTGDARLLFPGGRLATPTDYPNAAAALYLMAFWPAWGLAGARALHPAVRGVFGAVAALSAGVALLAVSRGSVFAMPICVVFAFVALPRRLRRAATVVPIAIAVAAAGGPVIHLTNLLGTQTPPPATGAAHLAGLVILAGSMLAGLAIALGARREARAPITAPSGHVLREARIIAGALLAIVVVGALAFAHPVRHLDNAWHSFKNGYATTAGSSRLASGLGSNRYDFYRVALDAFVDHPIGGMGVDNYGARYLRSGASSETPRFPHSIELRTLSETGIVGAILLFGALAAAFAAAWRAARARTRDDLRATAAGGALMVFAYWLVHGSADWFFEYAGLGGAAFAMLGLACSLHPQRAADEPADGRVPSRRAALAVAGVLAVAALPVLSVWLSDTQVRSAGAVFADAPLAAYDRLSDARSINPFSAAPDSLAGSIAVRFDDLARADAAFARAVDRNPQDEYATLLRGAIASVRGDHATAVALVRRAVALAPRDAVAADALTVVRDGGAIDLGALSQRIFAAAQRLG